MKNSNDLRDQSWSSSNSQARGYFLRESSDFLTPSIPYLQPIPCPGYWGKNSFPLLPLAALSKSQWLFHGVAIFSSPLADLHHSFEFETSHNSPAASLGKEDPSSALYKLIPHYAPAATSSSPEVPTSTVCHTEPQKLFLRLPSMINSHFSKDSRQNSECSDHPRQVNWEWDKCLTRLGTRTQHRHSTACGFWFPDKPASEYFRRAAVTPFQSAQILSLSSPRSPAPVLLLF